MSGEVSQMPPKCSMAISSSSRSMLSGPPRRKDPEDVRATDLSLFQEYHSVRQR